MEKIKPITKPLECDFYTIRMVDNEKCISIKGLIMEDVDGVWICERYPLLIISLKSFLESPDCYEDAAYAAFNEINREELMCTADKQVVEFSNTFFDGETANAYLNYSELTMDTPCGNYVSKETVSGTPYTELVKF